MNVFIAKLIMFQTVHRLDAEGYSISKIHSITQLDRRTIKRYLQMNENEFNEFQDRLSSRKKHLLRYEEFVKNKLQLYSDTSAAQMHDWLKEHYADFPAVNAKTVFNFVHWIRDKYNIPVLQNFREYEIVPELPYGKQAQVDFGEYTLRTSRDGRIKVFFFCMMLSRSRFKFLWFTTRNFTTELTVLAHEKAFDYIGGITEEIVYDQDKVLLVSENSGDLILTAAFRQYVQAKGFKTYFCRKSDPESKGKVENVIKYVKGNFLRNRIFHNEDTLNDDALAWLSRTANALPHSFTRKIPREEMYVEQKLLKPFIPEKKIVPAMTYLVRKDNTISWHGNFYSVPFGTYEGKGSEVVVRQEQDLLVVMDRELRVLCKHVIPAEKGLKVIKSDHRRDKTHEVEMLILNVANQFENIEAARYWLCEIYKLRARYMRDQLLVIQQILTNHLQVANEAMHFCNKNNIFSATDFKAIVLNHIKASKPKEEADVHVLNPLSGHKLDKHTQPEKSQIADYEKLFTK